MIELEWLLSVSAIAVGVVQARLLRWSVGSRSSVLSSFAFFARLSMVGAILFFAAWTGHIVAGALGWLVGFGMASVVLRRRLGG